MKNYLIEICRDYLNGTQTALESGINFDDLYSLSSVHNLSAIVFAVLNTAKNKEVVPKAAFKRFENDFFEAVIRYDFQGAFMDEISSLCESEGVRHVFFKGAFLRDLFPVPQARAMSDVDMLIDVENRDKLKRLLTANGFECQSSNGNVYSYTKDGLKLEAHTKIISGKIGSHDLEAAFENAIAHAEFDGVSGTLDNDYHFAYLIAHIAHHFWFYGAGAKLILDLAVMLKTCDISVDKVLKTLESSGLDGFARVILTVTHKWFGVGVNYEINTEKAEAFLLSYGAFGNAGRNNAAVLTRRDMEGGRRGGAVATRIRLLFPSYSKVKNIPYIGFIDGRPYLLPAAWVYRIYYNFRHRRDFVRRSTESLGSDEIKKAAAEELQFFEEINLL